MDPHKERTPNNIHIFPTVYEMYFTIYNLNFNGNSDESGKCENVLHRAYEYFKEMRPSWEMCVIETKLTQVYIRLGCVC